MSDVAGIFDARAQRCSTHHACPCIQAQLDKLERQVVGFKDELREVTEQHCGHGRIAELEAAIRDTVEHMWENEIGVVYVEAGYRQRLIELLDAE